MARAIASVREAAILTPSVIYREYLPSIQKCSYAQLDRQISALEEGDLHPDHVGGLCTADGQPVFPNAAIYLAENDFAYWTDEALLDTWAAPAIRVASANLLPLRERLVFVRDGKEFLPGVTAHFTDGSAARGTALVGVDGAGSRGA